MRFPSKFVRPLAMIALASFMVAGVTGCKWFRKGDRGDYALAPEARGQGAEGCLV